MSSVISKGTGKELYRPTCGAYTTIYICTGVLSVLNSCGTGSPVYTVHRRTHTTGRKGSAKTSVVVKSEYHTFAEPVSGEKEGKVAAEAYALL